MAKSFSNTIKKSVRTEARRTFQCKAKSKDPKKFWQALSEKMGKVNEEIMFLEIDGDRVEDEAVLAEKFAEFFLFKVNSLSSEPIYFQMPNPESRIQFSLI